MRKYLSIMGALGVLSILFCVEVSAKIYERDRYVKIAVPARQAIVYDDAFQPFPVAEENPDTTAEYFSADEPFWILAAEVDVVIRRPDGTIEVKSDEDAYARMVHHCNFIYVDGIKPFQLPYGTGSELTNFALPRPYAYKIQGGHMFPINWHFHNEGRVPMDREDIYLRFRLICDDEDAGYIDTNATWFDVSPLQSEFCIPPGAYTFPNPFRYPRLRTEKIVAAVAHVHDHVRSIRLMVNGEALWDYAVPLQQAYGYHYSHSSGCSIHSWHFHPSHLKQKTLQGWVPEKGILINQGTSVWVETEYYNDHATGIDGMAIVVAFFERPE